MVEWHGDRGLSLGTSFAQLHAVGYSEEEAVAKLAGDLDVFVSKFKPMK